MKKGITVKTFGEFESKPVNAYCITNDNGMQVELINYGATIIKLITPDKNGIPGNIILGFDSLEAYLKNGHQYFGAIVGRYCNRIAAAKFVLNEKEYQLALNDTNASLHGGNKGFDKVWWDIEMAEAENSLKLSYLSKDGEEGYPGNLNVKLIYTLTDKNELILDYSASTDMTTPVSLTSHCYFNLSAGKAATILDHELTIFADVYTNLFYDPAKEGPYHTVENTPLDFNNTKRIGKEIEELPGEYDHNMVLSSPEKAADLFDPATGRFMEVFTTEPGLQFYSGNYIQNTVGDESVKQKFIKHAALCLEAQHHPNSPNEPTFPSTVLHPGELYRQTTIYKFSVK